MAEDIEALIDGLPSPGPMGSDGAPKGTPRKQMVNALETQLLPLCAFDHFGDVRDACDVDFVSHQFFRKKLWQELSGNIFLLMHREVNRRLRV